MSTENLEFPKTREELISLIRKARDGSVDALEVLKSKYQPLIEAQVNRACADYMSNQDREDMREDALSAFCDAVCSYNCEEQRVEFGLYAKVCISNRLISFIRKYNARAIHGVASLDEMTQFVGEEQADPLELVIEEEKQRILIDTIQKILSPYEAKIWWLYTSGYSARSIADRVSGGDVRSVSNAIYRIRKKLRQAIHPD